MRASFTRATSCRAQARHPRLRAFREGKAWQPWPSHGMAMGIVSTVGQRMSP